MDILKQVQTVASEILLDDPELEKPENVKLKNMINKRFSGKIEI